MLETLHTILAFVVAIGVLITVHEYGHFLAARRLGVQVLRFSIGFGPALWRWHGKDGVEYVIAAIPLGGYVKMLGESGSGEVADLGMIPPGQRARAFDAQPVWKRAVIAVAGPVFNLLFAVMAFTLAGWIGMPAHPAVVDAVAPASPAAQAGVVPGDRIVAVAGVRVRSWQELADALRGHRGERIRLTVERDGARRELVLAMPSQPAARVIADPPVAAGLLAPVEVVVVSVVAGMPAEKAGLRAGDVVLAVDGVPVHSAKALVRRVRASGGKALRLRLKRGGKLLEARVVPQRQGKDYRIGAGLGERWKGGAITLRRGPVEGLVFGLHKTWEMTALTLEVIGKMLTRAISTDTLGGPILIAQLSGQAAHAGVGAFLLFLALISVNLGVLNLLPVPVLDGGHLLLLAVEAVRGRPLSPRVLAWAQGVGAAILAALMVLAFANDLTRWWHGR